MALAVKRRNAAHGRPGTNRIGAAGKRVEEVVGKGEANLVRAKAEEKVAADKGPHRMNIAAAAMNIIAAVSPTTIRDSQELG